MQAKAFLVLVATRLGAWENLRFSMRLLAGPVRFG